MHKRICYLDFEKKSWGNHNRNLETTDYFTANGKHFSSTASHIIILHFETLFVFGLRILKDHDQMSNMVKLKYS